MMHLLVSWLLGRWCWFSFFFFKQKTAYEMRISDWSSDVCSSDLKIARRERQKPGGQRIAAVFFAHIAEALQRMETAAGTRAVQAAEPRRFGGGKRRVPLEGAQYVKAAGKRLHIIGIGNSRFVAHGPCPLSKLSLSIDEYENLTPQRFLK